MTSTFHHCPAIWKRRTPDWQKDSGEAGNPLYDKELIAMAAKQSGMSEDIFEKADEKASSSLIYSLLMGTHAYNAQAHPMIYLSTTCFLLQTNIIKQVAQRGPCVIVGRVGNSYPVREPHCFNVYLTRTREPYETRRGGVWRRIKESSGVHCQKVISSEPIHYNFYTNSNGGEAPNYFISPLIP